MASLLLRVATALTLVIFTTVKTTKNTCCCVYFSLYMVGLLGVHYARCPGKQVSPPLIENISSYQAQSHCQ